MTMTDFIIYCYSSFLMKNIECSLSRSLVPWKPLQGNSSKKERVTNVGEGVFAEERGLYS
jgi:hypothetical protein